MGAITRTHLTCDHPNCDAVASIDVHRMDLHRAIPAGWWASTETISQVVACEVHAVEAREMEQAVHEWRKKECAARNAWAKKNPPPKVPRWLKMTA
jgi:hypothetical protein